MPDTPKVLFSRPSGRATRRIGIVALAVALIAAACSSSEDSAAVAADDSAADEGAATTEAAETEASDDAEEPEESGGDDAELPASNVTPDPDFDYASHDYSADPVQSALNAGPNNAAFPPPIVDPVAIVSGGPPPDGIPPIDNPIFISQAEAASFIADGDEPVVVVDLNGEARAYPISILIWHEIVNDEIGGVPVTVTYCPLCNSALTFDRRFGDRVLDFGTSGRLYQSALVMYDRQTESLWAHFTGQGIVGHFAGAQLDLIPTQTLSFDQFAELHPDGVVLSSDTGFSRNYGTNPYVGYDDETTQPISGFISQPIDERLASKRRVVGVVDEAGPVAITLSSLAESGVLTVDADGRNLVLFHQGGLASSLDDQFIADGADIGQTGVFIPEGPDGQALTFTASGDDTWTDAETGSTWVINGLATDGPLAGERLVAVPHLDTFWFSWSTYRPGTILVE